MKVNSHKTDIIIKFILFFPLQKLAPVKRLCSHVISMIGCSVINMIQTKQNNNNYIIYNDQKSHYRPTFKK